MPLALRRDPAVAGASIIKHVTCNTRQAHYQTCVTCPYIFSAWEKTPYFLGKYVFDSY